MHPIVHHLLNRSFEREKVLITTTEFSKNGFAVWGAAGRRVRRTGGAVVTAAGEVEIAG